MNGRSPPAGWAPLEARVAQVLGLRADDAARQRLVEGAESRMRALGIGGTAEYLARIDGPDGGAEMHALAQTLTIGESYFLRGADHFEVLADRVVPERLALPARQPRLRVLSAGCSSGEEIYSLAIVLADRFPQLAPEDVELVGVDITEAALAKARRGVYTAWSLRDVPADVIERHFRQQQGRYELSAAIRRRLRFERVNLLDPDAPIPPGPYDAIFCRNVLIYFTPEAMRGVVARFESLLAPAGYLFLGHSESLRGLSQSFRVCQSHETFYYQKLDAPRAADSLLDAEARRHYGWEPLEPAAPDAVTLQPEPALPRPRPRVSTAPLPPLPVMAPAAAAAARIPAHDQALACFRAERYAEAAALLEASDGPESAVLRAVALLLAGRIDDALARATRLHTRHPLNAEAACVLALCHEQLGEPERAREQLHRAIYLDADFAAPQLALARVAQRLRDPSSARRALLRAQQLVGRESELRLLLFGGGFSAGALRDLAGSQLQRLGARA